MSKAFNVEEKHQKLRMRKEDSRKLGARIDVMVRRAEAEGGEGRPVGCLSPFWNLLSRLRGRHSRVAVVELASVATSNGAAESDFNARVFGLAGVRAKEPAAKLEEAAALMRSRVAALEERAASERQQAVSLMKAGQKLTAKRALLKAKATEKQVEANQASLMAVEQQVDLLAQAAMQKQLTSALASTSKTMKKDAKALGRAEAAIDDATDARDMASDLNQVMAEFANGGNGDVDDDELLSELQSMVEEEPPPPPAAVSAEAAAASAAASAAAKAAEIAALEGRIAEWDDAEAVRQRLASVPGTASKAAKAAKREEKAVLLAAM